MIKRIKKQNLKDSLMKKLVYIGFISVIFTLVGCKKTMLVRDYVGQPFSQYNVDKNTLEHLEGSIVKAAVSLGWTAKKVQPGEIEATLNIRNHQLVVSIVFNEKAYSIHYKDSDNLMYNGKKIHRQYGNWTRNLINAINAFSIQS
jgi:hypothetical protein